MSHASKNNHFLTVKEASRIAGLDPQTLRKLADKGAIKCYRTPSGQRRIDVLSLQSFCSSAPIDPEKSQIQRQNFIYARVSTRKQMDDLSRQIEFIRQPPYFSYRVVTDIASGINFKRKGLSSILDSCLQGTIGEVVIAHRDRLCRFGFELIEQLVQKAGGKIIVLNNNNHRTSEQELTDDLMAIIHVFSCKQMGKRSYANRKTKDNKVQDLSNQTAERDA